MGKINIIPVGSGSTGNSIYIEIDERKILVDMGMGFKVTRDALAKYGRDIKDIEAIFLTHGHYDHTKGCVPICNNTSCAVYCDPSAMYPIRNIKAERIAIEMNKEFELLEGLVVKPFSVPHDYVKTCGYTFRYNGSKLGYLTDCGRMSDLIIEELSGSDVVIIESNHDIEMLKNGPYPKDLQKRILSKYGHLSNDDCADTVLTLYEKGTRNFILAHLSETNNTPQIALKTTLGKLKGTDAFVYACLARNDDLLSF